jgi:hypothetical protein
VRVIELDADSSPIMKIVLLGHCLHVFISICPEQLLMHPCIGEVKKGKASQGENAPKVCALAFQEELDLDEFTDSDFSKTALQTLWGSSLVYPTPNAVVTSSTSIISDEEEEVEPTRKKRRVAPPEVRTPTSSADSTCQDMLSSPEAAPKVDGEPTGSNKEDVRSMVGFSFDRRLEAIVGLIEPSKSQRCEPIESPPTASDAVHSGMIVEPEAAPLQTNVESEIEESINVHAAAEEVLSKIEVGVASELATVARQCLKTHRDALAARQSDQLTQKYMAGFDVDYKSNRGLEVMTMLSRTGSRTDMAIDIFDALLANHEEEDSPDVIQLLASHAPSLSLKPDLLTLHSFRFEQILTQMLGSFKYFSVVERCLSVEAAAFYTLFHVAEHERTPRQRLWIGKSIASLLMAPDRVDDLCRVSGLLHGKADEVSDGKLRAAIDPLFKVCHPEKEQCAEALEAANATCKAESFMFVLGYKSGKTGKLIEGRLEVARGLLLDKQVWKRRVVSAKCENMSGNPQSAED